MLSSLNLLATSATDEHPQDVRTSRCVFHPIHPFPGRGTHTLLAYLRFPKKELRGLIKRKSENCRLTFMCYRIHVPIAPNPHPSARTSEPSSSGSPDHAQYRYRPWDNGRSGVNGDRSRTRRARPLIQNKCEECVVARQKV